MEGPSVVPCLLVLFRKLERGGVDIRSKIRGLRRYGKEPARDRGFAAVELQGSLSPVKTTVIDVEMSTSHSDFGIALSSSQFLKHCEMLLLYRCEGQLASIATY